MGFGIIGGGGEGVPAILKFVKIDYNGLKGSDIAGFAQENQAGSALNSRPSSNCGDRMTFVHGNCEFATSFLGGPGAKGKTGGVSLFGQGGEGDTVDDGNRVAGVGIPATATDRRVPGRTGDGIVAEHLAGDGVCVGGIGCTTVGDLEGDGTGI